MQTPSRELCSALTQISKDCLEVYGKELISDLEEKHIAIDGKRVRDFKRKQVIQNLIQVEREISSLEGEKRIEKQCYISREAGDDLLLLERGASMKPTDSHPYFMGI